MKLEKINETELINFVKREVKSFNQCFGCGACSGICPVKKTTQVFDPRKIIYLLMLNFIDKLISEILWYCSQCGSCVFVCPMEVKPKDVIKSLRDFALEKGFVSEEKLFEIGAFARVNPEKCIVCLTCVRICPFSAASIKDIGCAYIDPKKCKACGICVRECPASAIELKLKPEYWEIKKLIRKAMKISILCCNYTNLSDREDLGEISGGIEIKRFPCSGHIEITDILKAFREGADGVMVVGCEKETCHNEKGSERAEKRVLVAKKFLEEIGIEKERLTMFYIPRLSAEDFVNNAKDFYRMLLKLKLKEKIQ